jgi:hypothetical protein
VVYSTGWSLGGGSVVPSRKVMGPTAADEATGGCGTGVGVGADVGEVGWLRVAPNAGGGGTDATGLAACRAGQEAAACLAG